MEGFKKSGWQDSNLRPPGPKPGAITGLRYIPNLKNCRSANLVIFLKEICGETGIRTLGTV
jgi:hypothetical protein